MLLIQPILSENVMQHGPKVTFGLVTKIKKNIANVTETLGTDCVSNFLRKDYPCLAQSCCHNQ